jgi:regulatory protein SWI6
VPQKRERELDQDVQEGKRLRFDSSVKDAVPVLVRPLTRATPPAKPATSIGDDPNKLEKYKSLIHSIFVENAFPQNTFIDLPSIFPPDLDPDTPIDDHLHTALHWAAALARTNLVIPLLKGCGADMFRGNDVGETPLVRAVLTTNHAEQDTFGQLLELLAPSIRTIDDLGRTILHHITLIAGVKGRAASAAYYLQSVLEYVARKEDGDFVELVDAQDKNGDTALNIAARVGSKGLVKMLLEVGADRLRANNLGLKPGDFGLDSEVRP